MVPCHHVHAHVIDYQSEQGNKCLRFDIGNHFDLSDPEIQNLLCPRVYHALFAFHVTTDYFSEVREPKICYISCDNPSDTIVFEIKCIPDTKDDKEDKDTPIAGLPIDEKRKVDPHL
ncbi:MAG: hypothetical protein GF411_19170 [Candidatus Lokiarchaeota archaeon]|nr:hypothetical protein [Candidatus Lokiarchaeota archaeon]